MKILVIGDSCTDVFIYGRCERLNPESHYLFLNLQKQAKPIKECNHNVTANNLNKLGVQKVELITNHELLQKLDM